jgi:hypothetical protein
MWAVLFFADRFRDDILDAVFDPKWCGDVHRTIVEEIPDIVITEIVSLDDSEIISEAVLSLDKI